MNQQSLELAVRKRARQEAGDSPAREARQEAGADGQPEDESNSSKDESNSSAQEIRQEAGADGRLKDGCAERRKQRVQKAKNTRKEGWESPWPARAKREKKETIDRLIGRPAATIASNSNRRPQVQKSRAIQIARKLRAIQIASNSNERGESE